LTYLHSYSVSSGSSITEILFFFIGPFIEEILTESSASILGVLISYWDLLNERHDLNSLGLMINYEDLRLWVFGVYGKETFCYLGSLVEFISVERMDTFGCLIESLELLSGDFKVSLLSLCNKLILSWCSCASGNILL